MALIRAPGAGAAWPRSDARRRAGRSEAVLYERGGPLNAAMVAAGPPIAVCCGLVRPGTAGVPCAGWRGRGTAVVAGGGLAGPRCGESALRSRGELDARDEHLR